MTTLLIECDEVLYRKRWFLQSQFAPVVFESSPIQPIMLSNFTRKPTSLAFMYLLVFRNMNTD